MINSKQILMISLLLAALPLCAASAMTNKNPQKSTKPGQPVTVNGSKSMQPVARLTTQQIMQQNSDITTPCRAVAKDETSAAKVGAPTFFPNYASLANHLETGSILYGNVTGAVGSGTGDVPGQIVLAMDNRIRSFCNNGIPLFATTDQVLDITTDQFFSVINPNGQFVTGTRVVFNPGTTGPDAKPAQWYITADSYDSEQATGNILLAIGDNPITATSHWDFILVDTANTSGFAANGTVQPLFSNSTISGSNTIAYDHTNIYLGVTYSSNIDLRYQSCAAYAIPYPVTPVQTTVWAWRDLAETLTGDPLAGSSPGNPLAPNYITPATNLNSNQSADTAYFVGLSSADFFASASTNNFPYPTGTSGQLLLLSIDYSTASAYTLTGPTPIQVPPYIRSLVRPLAPPTNGDIDVPSIAERNVIFQGFFFNQAYYNTDGYIYLCHEVACDSTGASSASSDRNGVRWYQLNPTTTAVNAYTVYDSTPYSTAGGPINFFTPSIYPITPAGTVAIGSGIDGTTLGGGYNPNATTPLVPPVGGTLNPNLTVVSGTTGAPALNLLQTSGTYYYPADDFFLDPLINWATSSSTVIDPSGCVWTFQPYSYNLAQGVWAIAAGKYTPSCAGATTAKTAKNSTNPARK